MKQNIHKEVMIVIILSLFFIGCSHSLKNLNNIKTTDYYEQINGTKLYFHVRTIDPNKPYILYLHGGPGRNSSSVRALFELLDYKINAIFLDQRGCGKSDRNVSKNTIKKENLIKDIDGVLDSLGIKKVILLGHSWGGTYSTLYASSRPDRVIALISANPVVSWDDALGNYYKNAFQYSRKHLKMFRNYLSYQASSDENINRFCRNHYAYYKDRRDKVKSTLFLKCIKNPKNLLKREIKAISSDLQVDLQSLKKFKKNDDPWIGWNKSELLEKYSMYRYNSVDIGLQVKLERRIEELYSEKEKLGSEIMNGTTLSQQNNNYPGNAFNSLDRIRKLKIPFYYLYGVHDHLFTSKDLISWMKRRSKSTMIFRFDESGHAPMIEEPHEFKKIIYKIYLKVSSK